MKTVLYGVKPLYPERALQLTERAGNMDIMPGDRVLVVEHLLFKNDKKTPWRSLLRPGTVVARYGILAYTYNDPEEALRYNEGIFGPHNDYVEIEMDNNRPTKDKKHGSFTDAVIKIKS